MKYIILFTLILTALSCKAQNTIISLADWDVPDDFNGVYFKDIDNDLDKFVGIWKYENGGTSLTISFLKNVSYYNNEWYEDRLIGEYKYIENGIEILNYLPRLTDPNINDAQHTITGNKIVYPSYPPECLDCLSAERRFVLDFIDRERMYLGGEILVKYININGVEKIRILLNNSETSVLPVDAEEEPRVPYGEYILTKQ